MPWMNYCKKCGAETPRGESCPFCGGKLTKAGERLSFGCARTVIGDWFAWNAALRVVLPALCLTALLAVAAEAASGGMAGVLALLRAGFLASLGRLLLGALALIALTLLAQGKESVHYVLDGKGAHLYVYLDRPTAPRLYARLLTPAAVEAMQDPALRVEGFTLVKRVELPWAQTRRVRFWPETRTALFYRPKFWQVIAVRCPPEEYAEAEAFIRRHMKRVPKAQVFPKTK